MATEISLKNNSSPKEWTYKCQFCMKEVVEETQTKCGHVFCEGCIQDEIAMYGRCPTCNKKATHGDLRRIYFLPNAICDINPDVPSKIVRKKETAMNKTKCISICF